MEKRISRNPGPWSIFLMGAALASALAYQNCSAGFTAISATAASNSSQGTDAGSDNGSGGDTGAGAGTSSGGNSVATNTSTPTVSYLYVGAPDKIAAFQIDRATEQVTRLNDIAVAGRTPGWFNYDATKNRILVSDGLSTMMTAFSFSPITGLLSLENTFALIANVIHFSLYPTTTGYQLYTASYDDSLAASYSLAGDPPVATQVSQVTFAAGTEDHSIVADRKLNLVFLATLGDNMIHIYNDSTGSLQQINTFPVATPRTMVYDAIYDRLYLTTQAATGSSYVYIFNIVQTNGVYGLSQVGAMPMGINGADIKVDHSHGYVSASVRNTGNEGVWLFPVDQTGLFDTTRTKMFLPVTQTEARSLQISSDGRYYAISCNNPINTVADTIIYELTYNADSSVATSKIISQQLVGPTNVLANLWVDVTN